MSREAEIIEALRDAIKAIDGAPFRPRIGRFDIVDAQDGDVLIRPTTMQATQRTSTHQEYQMNLLLGLRSKLRGDDDATGLHAFKQVCDDCGLLLRQIIESERFKPGAPGSVAAKLVRQQMTYWYRPKAQSGEAGGGILAVALGWKEPI